MPTTPYAGADQFATEVPLPDDTDDASVYDAAFEVVLDRTRWIYNRLARLAARMWMPVQSHAQVISGGAWDPRGNQWYGIGSAAADVMAFSIDQGVTWSTITPGAAGITLQSIACDNSAHVVATGTAAAIGLDAYDFDGTTWHTRTINVIGNCTLAEVAWESVNGLWAIYAWDNGSAPKTFRLFTSPDRATWTEQTTHLPATLQDSAGTQNQPRIGVGGGRIMVVNFYGGQFHASSCAGSDPTTWLAAASVTPFMATPTAVSDPLYNALLDCWIVSVTGTAVSTASEIWASFDHGATWQRIRSLGGTTFSWPMTIIRNLGQLVLGIRDTGATAYSTDFGATWYCGPTIGTAGATSRGLVAGDGNFLQLDTGGTTDGAQVSIAAGDPNAIAMGT